MRCSVPRGSGPRTDPVEHLLRRIALSEAQRALTIGFADDLALLVVNHITEGLKVTTNEALTLINDWIIKNGMALAHQMTKAIMLTRKRA